MLRTVLIRSRAPMCPRNSPSNSYTRIMRQRLSLGFLLTLPCLKMYVNAFRSLDNPRNFRKDGFERGKIE